jgi:alkylation response protein AidB-like acyl-CoA dehydrogenase
MDVTFTEEQQALRAAVADLLDDHSDPRATFASDTGADLGLYRRLVELGATDLPGLVELGIVLEECGRALVAAPLVSAIGIALPALEAAGAAELAALTRAGEAIPVLAIDLEVVPEAHVATHVVHVDGDDLVVSAVEACEIDVLPTMDAARRLCRVRPATGGERLADAGPAALAAAASRGAVAVAHELLGIAQATLDMAVAHAQGREQFGKPIGVYQAISHRCADMFVNAELARSHAYFAAWAVETGDDRAEIAASQAKASAAEAAIANAQGCIQVHGGIGFTWEHDAHMYLKRARSGAALLGTATEHRRRVAELMGL